MGRPLSQTDPLDALPAVEICEAHGPDDIAALVDRGVPVVIKGLIETWPALAAARQSPEALNAYLLGLDRGAPVPVMEAPATSGGRFGYARDLHEFTFSKRQRPLGETLGRIERAAGQPNAPFVAIQMLPLAQLPGFAQANAMPLVPAGTEPLLWLGGAVKTQIHNDRDHNLACVLAGHRRFVLFPPEQLANLYIGPPESPPPLSLVDPETPDFERFPKFRAALDAARVAHLGPGDALLMPKYWWHHVTSRDPYNAMVNYWWGAAPRGLENARDAFLMALLAVKRLPPGERRYWQAMFEAHVFDGENSAALAHLPPQLRGSLGALSPGARAALKRDLQTVFLKSSPVRG
jgi:hypothetical protein